MEASKLARIVRPSGTGPLLEGGLEPAAIILLAILMQA
jgi:hypothetical protein